MQKIEYKTPNELKILVKQNKKNIDAFFRFLRKSKTKNLDDLFHPLHYKAFENFDCLQCANCCSSISPIVTQKDIDKLARHFKRKPADMIDEYFHIDEDGDYVFNQSPCPFLMPDNYCMVYESRPKACREYPHTNRRKMIQILNITKKNCEICPVVYGIINELQKTTTAK
jgi:hypothetical protein